MPIAILHAAVGKQSKLIGHWKPSSALGLRKI